MISVCMATFNGAHYIREQLESILSSPCVSEVLISDDGSIDNTTQIISSFNDERIKLFEGPRKGLVRNFEFLLLLASNDYIFLSDQDDLWLHNKVEVMLNCLEYSDIVVCDCFVVDAELNLLHSSFFSLRNSKKGLFANLFKNRYLGCCMAIRRNVLTLALPFPPNLPMHDWWLGLIGEIFFRVKFVDAPLMMYRRHGKNASATAEPSNAEWHTKFLWRYILLKSLVNRILSNMFKF